MRMTLMQKLALGALVSVLFLMFVGAIVRATGAGMGCPDWPTCWGRIIPPTSVEQVNFDTLDIPRFQKKAARMGRDPASITRESLHSEFNATYVWTEYLNRLCSLPVGIFTLAAAIVGLGEWRRGRKLVTVLSSASLFTVLLTAWMGAKIVYSGLAPGVITAHLALAMALLGLLAYCVWAATDQPWHIAMPANARSTSRLAVAILLVAVVAEGIMGSQIRELTDALAKSHVHTPRHTWIGELENAPLYLIHRSFSWAILLATAWAWLLSRKHRAGGTGKLENTALAIVCAQMLLGVIMAHIHIYPWVQVLHVGLAAVLLTLIWFWWFALRTHVHVE